MKRKRNREEAEKPPPAVLLSPRDYEPAPENLWARGMTEPRTPSFLNMFQGFLLFICGMLTAWWLDDRAFEYIGTCFRHIVGMGV